jgi:hypothetical protein
MAVQSPFGVTYEYIPASTTAQVLGNNGAIGDTIMRVVATVTGLTTNSLTLLDGATSYVLVPTGTAIGVYSIDIIADSINGAWKITTGSNVTAIAVGDFS